MVQKLIIFLSKLFTIHQFQLFLLITQKKEIELEKKLYGYECEDVLDLSDLREKISKERSIFYELLKQVSFTTDIFRISVPSVLIHPISILEKFASITHPCSITDDINDTKEPIMRMLKVISWIIYNSRNYTRKTIYLIKPYNSIIGEIFKCSWDNNDGSKTYYFSEQVVHHPPISAFYSYNTKTHISYEGWCEPKGSLSLFSNCATTSLQGNFKITLHDLNEEYVIKKYAIIYVYNVFWGTSEVQLDGETDIECEKNKNKRKSNSFKR